MATSVYSFLGTATASSDLKTGSVTFNFDPPSNVRGKLCYVKANFFSWKYSVDPTTAVVSRDSFSVRSSWTHIQCGDTTSLGTRPGVALATNQNAFSYSSGPVLTSIPDGPHEVTFTVNRNSGDGVCGSGSTNTFFIALEFVAANGRRAPI
jgi:hypothetical protein